MTCIGENRHYLVTVNVKCYRCMSQADQVPLPLLTSDIKHLVTSMLLNQSCNCTDERLLDVIMRATWCVSHVTARFWL